MKIELQEKHYVAGFLFSMDQKRVALIRKTKPAWQAGRYNAVGGKIEEGETPLQAMRREFIEETGVDIIESYWENFAFLEGSDWSCHFFRTWGDPSLCETKTEEPVCVFDVKQIKLMNRPQLIGNIPWLVPLALDTSGGLTLPIHIKYS